MTDRLPYPGGAWSNGRFAPAVWSPDAQRVDLCRDADVAERTTALRRDEDGWWRGDTTLGDGERYAFAVDGSDARPDPRSAWQPDGVHGFSAASDPAAHVWADAHWRGRDARGAVIYELHIGTFTPSGTLDAAIERLDHLVDLGIDLVELMPLAAFGGAHGWGYDGVALFAVQQSYGGPAALKRFVDAAHARGIGVCLDVVYNHLGPSGNYLGIYGPYFTATHQTPWGAAVNLDAAGAVGMRRYIIDNACRWFEEFHLDALRLDAVHALIDESDRHILAELSDEVAQLAARLGRPLSLIAESDLNDTRMVTPVAQGGLGMTAQWADDVHHAVRAWLSGERHGWLIDFGSIETLEKVMTNVFLHDGSHSTFRDRTWGAAVPEGIDARRFVAFGTTHDQVGNRAIGDRPSALLSIEQLAAMHALILFAAFTPMLFMGEEWGATTPWQFFTDHAEPELAEAIRDGRRREFKDAPGVIGGQVPDPQACDTFLASKLDWDESLQTQNARLLDWVRRLIARRKREPALASGDLGAVRPSHGEGWLAIERGDLVLIIVSDAQAVSPELPQPATVLESFGALASERVGNTELPAGAIVLARLAQ